jgi:integrating conjugative element protein (TIGR03749 family)
MIKLLQRILLLFAFSISIHAQTQQIAEHVVWDKNPIKVTLPVGQERRIDFPVPGNIELPASIVAASKPVQLREDGSAYWTANEPFKAARVRYITNTGYSYFLDVEAVKDGPTHPLIIVDDRVKGNDSDAASPAHAVADYDFVDLARFASQSVYGPERLIKLLPGVMRVSVKKGARQLYRGGQLIMEPLASWKSASIPSQYVTAVRVSSNSLDDVTLDPRRLRGEWLAAVPQHTVVQAAGSDGDTTTWYLMSAMPFDEAAPSVTAEASP